MPKKGLTFEVKSQKYGHKMLKVKVKLQAIATLKVSFNA